MIVRFANHVQSVDRAVTDKNLELPVQFCVFNAFAAVGIYYWARVVRSFCLFSPAGRHIEFFE